MALGTALRMAGPKLFGFLTKNVPKKELAVRLGMDALGGAASAAYTPGDIGDKSIAALTDTLFSAGGGLLLGRFGGAGLLGTGLDYAGSIAGMDRDWETVKAATLLSPMSPGV